MRLVADEHEEEMEDNAPGAHAAALALGAPRAASEEITPEEEEALFAGPIRKKQRR